MRDVQAVADEQLGQPRGVRVVALGAGELVVHQVDGVGVDGGAPVVIVESLGRNRRNGRRVLSSVGRAVVSPVAETVARGSFRLFGEAHARHQIGFDVCRGVPDHRGWSAMGVVEDVGGVGEGAAEGRIAVAVGAEPQVFSSLLIHVVDVVAVTEHADAGRGPDGPARGRVVAVLVDEVAAEFGIGRAATRYRPVGHGRRVGFVVGGTVFFVRIALPGAAQIGLAADGVVLGHVHVVDVVTVGAADFRHGVGSFGVGEGRAGH